MSLAHIVIMGVSGSGKSTVGTLLAESVGRPLIEADELHSRANIDKMSASIPLNDRDRAPWLAAIGAQLRELDGRGLQSVLVCSALRKAYRDELLGASNLLFVHLVVDLVTVEDRLHVRRNHFMPAALLDSQFQAMENLSPGEPGFEVDGAGAPEKVVSRILERLELADLTIRQEREEPRFS